MKRSAFLKLLALSPLTLSAMKLKELETITHGFTPTEKMPVLFLKENDEKITIFNDKAMAGFLTVTSIKIA